MAFGVSTHLFVADRLDRDHLVEIAAHGFEAIEVFAVRDHFDYRDRRAAVALAEWLDDTRLRLHSMHAPIAGRYVNGSWHDGLSLASADEGRRKAAVDETLATLEVAAAVPYDVLVAHCGVPAPHASPGDNHRGSLVRSLEELAPVAQRYGVRLAIEVIPNDLSTPTALVELIESDIEAPGLGICMDVGHARLMGDVVDAIETCSGHLLTTHLHDNRGRTDEHLVPGKGVIDWNAAVLAFQKVGYDGVWLFELAAAAERKRTLEQAVKARERFESLLHIGDEMMGPATD
ncbi:MAG TPA: sugar phosphate isomerase/epimerase family protein [Vicinamibacterales bacterium]|nr:sugar phosphate isomerase/epimerase family protein [Vicinamibacterales bacterium]